MHQAQSVVEGLAARSDEIAAKVTEHSAALASAAGEMTRAQNLVDRSLEERGASLTRVMEAADHRAGELERLISNVSQTVETTFAAAERRAQDLASKLALTAQSSSGAVVGQFATLRDEAERERALTAQALHAAYEQTSGEMQGLFGDATERFRAAAAEMRGVAGQVQRELDEMRTELQRSVTALPRQAAEQAAAMRKVVSDQVKALNALSDVVSGSGRAYGASGAVAISASEGRAEPAPRPEPARAAEPAPERPAAPRPLARSLEQELSEEVARARQDAPAPAPTPRRAASTLAVDPAPAPRPAASTRAATPPAPQPRGGWLSDLLARASADEEPTPPAPTPGRLEPLDSISHDIARLVDNDTTQDAWERYRRGDRTGFSRRLYTPAGQQTYDEVRRRYRADASFRGTVDRYLTEFERMLEQIAQDDRDSMVTRSYLLSDTGKVYTLLGHAAGRFD